MMRVDAPGHGGSRAHQHASVERAGSLLLDTIPAAGTRPHTGSGPHTDAGSVLLGYSMGARMCLSAAVQRPESVAAVILIGGTAGIESAEERERRRAIDEERAQRLERIGVKPFLREWLSMDMFAGLPAWARFDDERATNTADGLAASLRHAGTGSMEPLWDRVGSLGMPLLCLSGRSDPRYGDLGERIAGLAPRGTALSVPGAGHAAHLENPPAVIEAVDALLEDIGGAGPQADSR